MSTARSTAPAERNTHRRQENGDPKHYEGDRLAWTFGDRLRKAREVAGLGVQELADELLVSRNTISRYESGATKRITDRRLKRIAEVTGVTVEWLQHGDGLWTVSHAFQSGEKIPLPDDADTSDPLIRLIIDHNENGPGVFERRAAALGIDWATGQPITTKGQQGRSSRCTGQPRLAA